MSTPHDSNAELPAGDPAPASQLTGLDRVKALLENNPDAARYRRVHVIVNPAAGKDQPILKALNAAMQLAGADWDVFVTKEAGDGRRLAGEAVRAGADLVAVHGGDGTVMEVAAGLMGAAIPLAIIPGGTANVMAMELGIPAGLVEACALAIDPTAQVRQVDMGQAGEHYFILRAGMGFEAEMVDGAPRELKDRLGLLAYAVSALQALANPPVARYRLMLDGVRLEIEGLTCMIANSGSTGIAGLTLNPLIDVSDGLLDVVIVTRADLPSLASLAAGVIRGQEEVPALRHWQAREIQIEADPPQRVQVDGEIVSDTTPLSVRVIPQAVRVVVPAGPA